MRNIILLAAGLLSFLFNFAQVDSSFIAKIKSLDTANILRLDTTAVPNDRITQKIKQLRSERGGWI